MRHYQVITIGESTVDAFMTLHHANEQCKLDPDTGRISFKHGDKIDVERYDFCLGGNATNVAVGLTRLGIRATLCTEIGDDEFSLKIRNALAKEHIDRLYITEKRGMPSNFSVIISFKNDRTIFVEDVEREHNYQLDDVSTDYIYLTSMGRIWQEPYHRSVVFARENNCKLVFNPGSRQMYEGQDTVQHVIRHTYLLIVNKEEAEKLLYSEKRTDSTNEHDYIKHLLEKLQKLGPKIIVITNGQHGSMAVDQEGTIHYRSLYPSKVVEKTGAGDAYSTGFLAALIHGLPIPDAMTWGSINAASVVSEIGAEAGLLTKHEMEERAK